MKELGAHVLVDTTDEADKAKYMGENGFDVSDCRPPFASINSFIEHII